MYYGPNSTPISEAEKTRPVYLPAGSDWFDFWSGKRFDGGQTIISEAGLDTIPIFVRAGSILPLGPQINHTEEQPQGKVCLQIYPGQDGAFTLYQDEGDNYNYEKGSFSTIRLRWEENRKRLIIEERQGSFPGMKKVLEFCVSLMEDGNERQIVYNGNQLTIDFNKL
jgi:alpha-D-xyloside xylohydrolase